MFSCLSLTGNSRHVEIRRWAIICQSLVRGWIGRRLAVSQRAYIERLAEERDAGIVR